MAPAVQWWESPNHGGRRAETLGIVLHSTRGGTADEWEELSATLNWFASVISQVSAHVVIAYDGTLVYIVDPDLVAWHAGEFNQQFLGAELVQPKAGDHISNDQLRTLAWWIEKMTERYGFPIDEAHLPEHRQTPQGIAAGKSDIGPDYSFRRMAALAGWG